MDEAIEARLARLGVVLPVAAAPAANYLPFVRHENLLFISGQLPMNAAGIAVRGRLGDGVSLEEGRQAAKLCALNVLAQAKAALAGDLERIVRLVRITGYVASAPGFTEQHLVVNGASDFLAEALGERGKHARAAIGTAALPLDAAVEIDAILAVA
jgi:enamine deaminase RidA (YjgF/YER057c/UK114 family)